MNTFTKVRPLACTSGWVNMRGLKRLSLEDIAEMTMDIQEACWDIIVPAGGWKEIDFKATPTICIGPLDRNLFSLGTTANLTPTSSSQIYQRYGLTNSYAHKCLEQGHPDLLELNINTWMHEDTSGGRVRMIAIGDRCIPVGRAVLSPQYIPYDSDEIVRDMGNHAELCGKFFPCAYSIDMERMHIRFVSNDKLDVHGENLRMGIMCDSSDVGLMAVTLRMFVQDMSQGTAIVLPSGGFTYRQIHRGTSHEGFRDDIDNILSSIPKMKDAVRVAVEASKSKSLWFKLFDEEDIERFAKANNLSKKLMGKTIEILKSLKYGNQNSVWAFINSLTEAAQTLSLEERLEAEKKAGSLFMSTAN